MANLRIIASNAARRATLTASSTAGLLAVTSLVGDKKSDVWRATSTTARVSGTLSASELASGAALWGNFSPTATMRVRLTNEVPTTNALTAPNDFTNAAWTKTNLNLTPGAVGPDGTNSATTLTAAASNAELKQVRTVAAGANASSIFIRRRAGSGPIYIRNAANTSWIQPIGLSTSWTRFTNDGGATGTSALVDIMIGASGDAVDVAFAQLESGPVATSYFPGTRPAGFIDSWQSYDCDTGVVLACPAPAVVLEGWSAAQSASAYAYGGGAYARAWFPETPFRVFAIDLVDMNNLQGYIEASKLVIGRYWSPPYGVSSVSETYVDEAVHYSTDAGDLLTRASTISKEVPVEFRALAPADRERFATMLRASRAYPIFMSVFAGHSDLELERSHTVLGKRMGDSEVALQAATRYGTKITVRSI